MSDHLSVSLATTGSSEHPVRLKTSDDSVSGSDTAAAIAEAPKGHDDESDFTGVPGAVSSAEPRQAATLDQPEGHGSSRVSPPTLQSSAPGTEQWATSGSTAEGEQQQLEQQEEQFRGTADTEQGTTRLAGQPYAGPGGQEQQSYAKAEEQEQKQQQEMQQQQQDEEEVRQQEEVQLQEAKQEDAQVQEAKQEDHEPVDEEAAAARRFDTKPAAEAAAAPPPPPPPALAGKSCLVIASKPSALLSELTHALLQRGAHVSLAVKHAQDAQLFVKNLRKRLPAAAEGLLDSTDAAINMASQASIRSFASAVNSSTQPLDLLLLDTVESGGSTRRWYTPEGVAGEAQLGFLGPAYLLHLLQPKLAASSTAILLTSTPLHRLGTLDDLGTMLHSWAGANTADLQLAVLCYVRQLAERLHEYGVTAAAVDMGVLREQPLSGSLLRKLPPLPQLLHLLLPSAADAASFMAGVAEELLTTGTTEAAQGGSTAPDERLQGVAQGEVPGHSLAGSWAGQQAGQQAEKEKATEGHGKLGAETETVEAAVEGQQPAEQEPEVVQKQEGQTAGGMEEQHVGAPAGVSEGGVKPLGRIEAAAERPAGAAPMAAEGEAAAGQKTAAQTGKTPPLAEDVRGTAGMQQQQQHMPPAAPAAHRKSFRYVSRGLLATPLLTYLDHAGRASWITRVLSQVTYPFYQLTSSTIVNGSVLLDWPARAWLLAPAGALTGWTQAAFGKRGAALLAQVQRVVPGVEGVPQDGGPVGRWVEVTPAALVLSNRLGEEVWELVDAVCAQH